MRNRRSLVLLFVLLCVQQSLQESCNYRGNCTECNTWDGYETWCNSATSTNFHVEVQFGEAAVFKCNGKPLWKDFVVKPRGNVSDVKLFKFSWCPMPNTTFHEITQSIWVQPTEELIIDYTDLGSRLERRHLAGFPTVTRLSMNSDELTKVPADLLADFPELTVLVLRGNKLQLPLGFFKNVPKLEALELGNNNLTRIDPSWFEGLDKLGTLGIWKNELTEIEEGTFDALTALFTMEISWNNLTTLPEDIFAKLKHLNGTFISSNNFASLPANLLSRNRELVNFGLRNNRGTMRTLPNRFLADLPKLEVIRVENSNLTELPEDIISGSSAIKNITFRGNSLTTLPKDIFNGSINLRTLDLSRNRITDLPDGIFEALTNLEKLELQNNHLTHISNQLFSRLRNLREINLEYNQISRMDSKSFLALNELQVARLSHNQLTLQEFSRGNQSPFRNCFELRDLQLAHNNISWIFQDWYLLLGKLRSLDLKFNNISVVSYTDFQFMSGNILLDIRHNNISWIDFQYADLQARAQPVLTENKRVKILIEDNPIACDCYLSEFLRYLSGDMHPNLQRSFYIEPGHLTCGSPPSMKHIRVSQLEYKTFVCDQKQCPEECTCSYRTSDNTLVANCAYRNLSTAPESIDIIEGHNVELNLTGNCFNEVPFINQTGRGNITKLYLSNNNISMILPDNIPSTLVTLTLDNNKLTRIDSEILDRLNSSSSLAELKLHGNPWVCDCEARDFLSFVQLKFEKIRDLSNVTCASDERQISKLTATDMCPSAVGIIIGSSLGIAIFGLLVGILAALYYRYELKIKVWLFAHNLCLWFVTEEELDRDKKFDAFISYSHEDDDFVTNQLVPELEKGPKPFKLCLHFRDWIAGEWIPTQIARSVDESRRTVVVLSPNFLESVWGRMEFRAAHSQALSEGRARVIVVLYGDIGPTENLDPELKAYLSMNTYVEWGDPWFWDKLRYALPHPPKVAKGNARRIYENHQHHIKLNGDKNGLIGPPGYPVTPPAVTTPPADSLKTFTTNGSLASGILITDCLRQEIKRYEYPDAKHDVTPDENESLNNMINSYSTHV